MTLKRTIDVLGALAGLAVTSPVWVIAAVVVKLSSRGPVFHRAVRIGKDEVPFALIKFRTMRTGEPGLAITAAGDPRITPVGRVLRRLKIDELPQLLNVLRGDMSLVGPRPEDPKYVERYTDEQRRVLSVRPGITSPAAVAFSDEEHVIGARGGDVESVYMTEILPAKLALDLDYVTRRTLWLDLTVLARTGLGILCPRVRR